MAYPYKGSFRISNAYNKPDHNGLDCVGIDSKSIYAVADGVVEVADNKGTLDPNGFGCYVRIAVSGQANPTYDYYGHLAKNSIVLYVGGKVKAGDLLGTEGNTGKSTGNHLHIERRVGGYDRKFAVDISKILGIQNKEGAIIKTATSNAEKVLVKQAEFKLTATKTVTEDKVKAETESLKKLGYDVVSTQTTKAVYEDKPVSTLKSNVEIAKEVLQGKWGNGKERKDNLTKAGYDYSKVQAEVNKLMK